MTLGALRGRHSVHSNPAGPLPQHPLSQLVLSPIALELRHHPTGIITTSSVYNTVYFNFQQIEQIRLSRHFRCGRVVEVTAACRDGCFLSLHSMASAMDRVGQRSAMK